MRAKVLAVPFSAKHQIATKTHKWGHQHVSVNTTATMATGIRERINYGAGIPAAVLPKNWHPCEHEWGLYLLTGKYWKMFKR